MKANEEDQQAVRRFVSQLQRARAAQGLSQADLAQRMGVSQATVSEFEASTSDPYLWTVQRYARALNIALVIDAEKLTITATDLATPPE